VFITLFLQKRIFYLAKKEYEQGTFREKLFEDSTGLLPKDHPGSRYRIKTAIGVKQ
jgi:hypothetical protein